MKTSMGLDQAGRPHVVYDTGDSEDAEDEGRVSHAHRAEIHHAVRDCAQ